jgi:hypothetical protein
MVKSKYRGIWLWILITILIGTFWHFVYQLSGDNFLVGLIAPINESVWEHLKIVFFPFIIVSIVAYLKLKPRKNCFWLGILTGSIVGMLIVFFSYYLYTLFLSDALIIDILIYIASIIVAMYIAWWFNINIKSNKKIELVSVLGLAVIAVALIYLTIKTPRLKPFIEDSSGQYGIYKSQAN